MRHRRLLRCASWLPTGLPTVLSVVADRRESSLGREETRPRMAILQLEYVGPNLPHSTRAILHK